MSKFNDRVKEILAENNVAGGIDSAFNSGAIQAGDYGNQFPSQNDKAYAPGDARMPYSVFSGYTKKKRKKRKIVIQRRRLKESTDSAANNYGFTYEQVKPAGWGFITSTGAKVERYMNGWKVIRGGTIFYYKDKNLAPSSLHRTDGPAIETRNKDRCQYFLNGKNLSPNEYRLLSKKVRHKPDLDTIIGLTDI